MRVHCVKGGTTYAAHTHHLDDSIGCGRNGERSLKSRDVLNVILLCLVLLNNTGTGINATDAMYTLGHLTCFGWNGALSGEREFIRLIEGGKALSAS